MSEQPEALRLADIIEKSDANFYGESTLWFDGELSEAVYAAMDLLRSQHARIEKLEKALNAGLEIFTDPVFGTWQYMEGSAFYEDVAALVKTFREALEQP